jgi:nitrogen fixation protein FixH
MNGRPAFTGRHMAAILIGFFSVVVAVNLTMASLASNSFSGTVVDNSYVASQKYNSWLASARAQEQLGWATTVSLDNRRRVVIGVSATGGPGTGLAASGTARHPMGGAADVPLRFTGNGTGQLVSTTALPAGRWQLRLEVRDGRHAKRLLETLS